MTITVVDIHKGACTPPFCDGENGDVYIGHAVQFTPYRNTKWQNPFSVEKHGREGAIALYRTSLEIAVSNDPSWLQELIDVHEKHGHLRLGCWCKPLKCHGDVLKEYLEEAIMETKK